jgi:putative tricarboxylic transport membrane protein
VVLLVVAGAYAAGTVGLPSGQGEPGPAFFPRLVAAMLALIGLVIGGHGLTGKMVADGGLEEPTPSSGWKAAAATVLMVLYVLVFEPLGFVVSTWLFTLAVMVVFRRRRLVPLVILPVLSTLALYLLFGVVLDVRLPPGPLGAAFDAARLGAAAVGVPLR